MARLGAILLCMALLPGAALASDPHWTAPTDEELKMTSVAQATGAGAIFLFREQITVTTDLATTYYFRIKVLNDKGKDRATIEMPYDDDSDIRYEDFAGRTIHSDGTIVDFTGKAYEKLVEKTEGHKYKVKIFSLPSVEVGSILEYRFKEKWRYERAPDWFVQSNLFLRKGHFLWTHVPSPVAWLANLPEGAKIDRSVEKSTAELTIEDVAPPPHDEWMPPLDNVSYRVIFYHTPYQTADQFWTAMGQEWSPAMDKFLTPGKPIHKAVADMIVPGDTDEQKVRKIYAAIMAMPNTEFIPALTAHEEKAKGIKGVNSIDDVLTQGRGTPNGLTFLFVSMVRAAGLKAYLMRVADRAERLFVKAYLATGQLDSYIAIVNVGGKDVFLDPGQPFCPYGQLAWFHSLAEGQRQTETGTALLGTPNVFYRDNRTTRTAYLTVDAQGNASGIVAVTYAGDAARQWRQTNLRDDSVSMKAALKRSLTGRLPAGMEIEVATIGDLTSYDKPLQITFEVHGLIGTSTGKRLLLPAFLFQAQATPLFTTEKRDVPVDMRYADFTQDAIRYTIPPGMMFESVPGTVHEEIKGQTAFDSSSKLESQSIIVYRNLGMAHILYTVAEYPALHDFYKKIQSADQESIVLTRAPAAAKPVN